MITQLRAMSEKWYNGRPVVRFDHVEQGGDTTFTIGPNDDRVELLIVGQRDKGCIIRPVGGDNTVGLGYLVDEKNWLHFRSAQGSFLPFIAWYVAGLSAGQDFAIDIVQFIIERKGE